MLASSRGGWWMVLALPLALTAAGRRAVAGPEGWQAVAEGLDVGRFTPPRAAAGDGPIVVVRVDPARYEFRLLSAKLLGLAANPTASEWVEGHGVIGAINASMFGADQRTSVGYMRDGERKNNGAWSKDKAVFASQPLDPSLPPAQIIDRTCQDLDALADRYRVLVQSIRMLDCAGKNVWAQQPRKWSTACVGSDARGRMLLIHARAPYTTHDLVEILRALPLDVRRLMYVEGGPEASLYVKAGGRVIVSEMGSFETGFWENDDNRTFWPLPNVLAFAPK